MRRSHRTVHRIIWPVLALALAIGFALALLLRPPPESNAALPEPAALVKSA